MPEYFPNKSCSIPISTLEKKKNNLAPWLFHDYIYIYYFKVPKKKIRCHKHKNKHQQVLRIFFLNLKIKTLKIKHYE